MVSSGPGAPGRNSTSEWTSSAAAPCCRLSQFPQRSLPLVSGCWLVGKFELRPFAMILQCQFYQAINQLGQRNPAGFPELRIHADRCEPGNCVHLVDE